MLLEGVVMKTYIISGKEYKAASAEGLLEQMKNENAFTKDKSLEEYIDTVVATALNMTEYKIDIHKSLSSKANDVIQAWEKMELLSTRNSRFETNKPGPHRAER